MICSLVNWISTLEQSIENVPLLLTFAGPVINLNLATKLHIPFTIKYSAIYTPCIFKVLDHIRNVQTIYIPSAFPFTHHLQSSVLPFRHHWQLSVLPLPFDSVLDHIHTVYIPSTLPFTVYNQLSALPFTHHLQCHIIYTSSNSCPVNYTWTLTNFLHALIAL